MAVWARCDNLFKILLHVTATNQSLKPPSAHSMGSDTELRSYIQITNLKSAYYALWVLSISSYSTWLSRAWVSHWGSADCGVCCPDGGCAVGPGATALTLHCDPFRHFRHCSMSLNKDWRLVWKFTVLSPVTRSSLHPGVCWQRNKGRTHVGRSLCCFCT